jgi:hypothetical protein
MSKWSIATSEINWEMIVEHLRVGRTFPGETQQSRIIPVRKSSRYTGRNPKWTPPIMKPLFIFCDAQTLCRWPGNSIIYFCNKYTWEVNSISEYTRIWNIERMLLWGGRTQTHVNKLRRRSCTISIWEDASKNSVELSGLQQQIYK